MAQDCLLALDQGTSSSRALVFGPGGDVVALAQRELVQHYPQPGWVEHDARDIWRDQLDCAREALQRAAAQGLRPAALGISNQRETTLLWDRASGEPLHRAIVWQDRRTAAMCDALRAQGLHDEVRARTSSCRPCERSASHIAAVRRSCQTIARCSGSPLARSHSSVVSRWLLMPSAAARCSASRAQPSWSRQMSSASCSTQPGCG